MKQYLFLILLLSIAGCKKKETTDTDLIRSVKTLEITQASTLGTRMLSGVLKPADESDLSFQVGGTIETVDAKLGDFVKKDQILASLDPRDFELKLQSAKAALNSAKAELSRAEEELKRQETLKKGNYTSKAKFEKAQSDHETAISQEKIEIALVEEATRDLERTKLLAPFNGQISLRNIEPHQETQAGRIAFKLQSSEGLKAEVLVPESLIRELSPKQEVIIEFPTLKDYKTTGKIREIGAQSDTGNAFPVTIDLIDPSSDLRAGMSTQIIFNKPTSQETPIYLIPLSAINTRDKDVKIDKPDKNVNVFLFNPDTSTVHKKNVTVGDIQENQIEVTKGLENGDILVTAGVPFLEEGQPVRQWKPKYRSPESDK